MKTKLLPLAAAAAVAGGVWFALQQYASSPQTATASANPAAVTSDSQPAGGKQVVEIAVKEGYQPKEITAKAGVPVLLKMKTQGTFDCTSAFSIPALGIQARLQPTGESTFDIPAQKAGEKIYGVCSMGMYSFVIKFG